MDAKTATELLKEIDHRNSYGGPSPDPGGDRMLREIRSVISQAAKDEQRIAELEAERRRIAEVSEKPGDWIAMRRALKEIHAIATGKGE